MAKQNQNPEVREQIKQEDKLAAKPQPDVEEIKPDELRSRCVFEIPSMSKPTDYLGFHSDRGATLRSRAGSLDEPKVGREKVAKSFPNFTPIQVTLPINAFGSNGIKLPLGLTIISGDTKVGKTLLVKGISRHLPISRIMAVEPYDEDSDVADDIPCYNSVDAAIAVMVQARLDGSEALPALDSLRESLYEISGAAGSKGVTNAFFTALTRLSNGLARADLSMLAIVNPMHTETDYVTEFKSKLSSAVPAVLWITSSSISNSKSDDNFDAKDIKVEGTIAIRPFRDPLPFVFDSRIAATFETKWSQSVTPMYMDASAVKLAKTPPSVAESQAYKRIQEDKSQ
jgi:hypothetical protein